MCTCDENNHIESEVGTMTAWAVLVKQDGIRSSVEGSTLTGGSMVKWEQSVGTEKEFEIC